MILQINLQRQLSIFSYSILFSLTFPLCIIYCAVIKYGVHEMPAVNKDLDKNYNEAQVVM